MVRSLGLHGLPIAAALLVGCVPLPSRTQAQRGPIWAQPGDATVLAWSVREKTSRMIELTTDPHDHTRDWHWVRTQGTRIDRTWIVAVDPATGEGTQLAPVRVAVEPFYWDAAGAVLWVRDAKDSLLGLSAAGPVHAPGRLGARENLPAPFAVLDGTQLFHVGRRAAIALPRERLTGAITIEGELTRLTSVRADGDVLVVDQATVDWTGGRPTRHPDLQWSSPALDTERAKRVAVAVLADGRHLAEVLDTGEGMQLFVYDFVTAQPPIAVPLDLPEGKTPTLYALAGDRVLAGVREPSDEASCMRGALVAAASRAVVALAEPGPCVTDVTGVVGRRWLQVASGSAYVDAQAQLVELGVHVGQPLVLGPTTIAYTRPDRDGGGITVEQLELATGARTTLAHHDRAGDKLLTVTPDRLVFLQGAATLVTVVAGAAPGAAALATAPLPALLTDGPDGTPLAYETAGIGEQVPRTQLWVGFDGGVSTGGQGVFGILADISRWTSEHTNVSIGVLSRMTDTHRDVGGKISLSWFPSPIRGGWFVGAEAGIAHVTHREDRVTLAQGFAPTLGARVGYRGRLVALHLAAVMPSLVDTDRGVHLLGGLSLGLFGK